MANVGSVLPLLVNGDVILPGSSAHLTIKDKVGISTVEKYLWSATDWTQKYFGVVSKITSDTDNGDGSGRYHAIGTVVTITQVVATSTPESSFRVHVAGTCRFRLKRFVQNRRLLVAEIKQLDGFRDKSMGAQNAEVKEMLKEFHAGCAALFRAAFGATQHDARLLLMQQMLRSLPVARMVDVVASGLPMSNAERREVLETVDVKQRLALVLSFLRRKLESIRATASTDEATTSFDGISPESRAAKTQPGRRQKDQGALDRLINSDSDEMEELEQRIKDADLPEAAMKAATKEFKRLKKMPSFHPEHAVIRNYLELLVDLPWSKSSVDRLDIEAARHQLDADHYGLEKTKRRVLEYLAVRKLKSSLRGPILCLVGPPGVGKTSVARSIATSIGRSFHRISLGGISDEADIRGHRRTYVASMPGRIISGLKSAGVNNPVFLLDEVDKMTTASIRGDPAAALLEVLDSEQNHSFTDHFLTVPFDLSQVLFIATANTTASIPGPLKDRMEIIRISGYNIDEKLHIAERHLMSKQLKEHGIDSGHLVIPRPTLSTLVTNYTREAGVRSLERKIGAVCRAVALQLAEGSPEQQSLPAPTTSVGETSSLAYSSGSSDGASVSADWNATVVNAGNSLTTVSAPMAADGRAQQPLVVTPEMLEDLLGPREYVPELGERLMTPGVAMGLAWTSHGGELLFVEAISMPGTGRITVTGNLGDVMKESAQLAMSWIRAHAHTCGIQAAPLSPSGDARSIGSSVGDLMKDRDVHIHFPAGAIGKDGPSAGVTILVVLVSLFSGRCVRSDTAMTGELALRGRVLPVGGIKEKILAAHTAGVRRVLLPAHNRKDVKEISADIKDSMELFFIDTVAEALQLAFDGGLPVQSRL